MLGYNLHSDKFEDTKEAIICRELKDRQYNVQKKKVQTMTYKTLHRKLNFEQHESNRKPVVNRGATEGLSVTAQQVTLIVLLLNYISII